MNKKTVYISKEGCSVFPHLSIHTIINEDDETYYTENDRFDKSWTNTYDTPDNWLKYNDKLYTDTKALFVASKDKRYYDWNTFRSLGYITDTGERTNYFTEKEYQEFEEYSKKNNLRINYYGE